MAAKWADYVITAKRFNSAGTHIESVRVYVDGGDNLVNPSTMSRREVVNRLEQGDSFCTATRDAQGKWRYGAPVQIIVIEGEKFIKTKPDRSKADNLDELPTF